MNDPGPRAAFGAPYPQSQIEVFRAPRARYDGAMRVRVYQSVDGAAYVQEWRVVVE